MILSPHLITGAVFGKEVTYLPLAILLAIISHYFLDVIPHWEYAIENITEKKLKKSALFSLRVFLDLLTAFLIIYFATLISKSNFHILLVCAVAGAAPDFLTVLRFAFPDNKLLKKHWRLHRWLHFHKNKKISLFWKIFSQIVIMILGFFLLIS